MTRRIYAIAVVGSRNFPGGSHRVTVELDCVLSKAVIKNLRLHIISGGAPGVDTWAIDWAKDRQVMYTVIPAEWDRLGNRAGFARNPEIWAMAVEGIAFWDGESNGTRDSFKIAKDQNKVIKIVTVNHEGS